MQKIAFELPLNSVSFGDVSILILRTIFEQERINGQKYDISLFPIGHVDFSAQTQNLEFQKWINSKIQNGLENHSKDTNIFKLWHLSNGIQSYSKNQTLLSFYELDEPTKIELNAAKNNKTLFSSKYTCEIFRQFGVETGHINLAFDSYNFNQKLKKIHSDGRIVFNVLGKFEKRKGHEKVIKAWIRKYGNNPKYALQCAIFNPFLGRTSEEINNNNQQIASRLVDGKKPYNVSFYPKMQETSVYNEFLNSSDIVLGLSGGEGWGLGEFQSVALGKHAVLLKAHSYKDWATDEMVTWVNPSGKIPAYDGLFFQKGQSINQGNIFNFNEEEFLAACDTAVRKVENNRVNQSGLTLQTTYTKEKLVDNIISHLT